MDINVNESDIDDGRRNVVERAIMRMLFSNSDAVFYAYFMVKMAMKEGPQPPHSLGMSMLQHDGLFTLGYNLERLQEHNIDDINSVTWICGHECWHWVLNHQFRELEYFERSREMMMKWHKAWNVAADLEIHEHYPPAGKLAGLVCHVGDGEFKDFPKNLTAEEYFKLIVDQQLIPPQTGGGSGSPQPGGQPGDADQDSDGEGGEASSETTSQNGRYKIKIQGAKITITDTKTGEVSEVMVNDTGVPEENEQSPLDQEVLRQQMAEAFKEARPSMGTEPGGLSSMVEKLIAPPRIDWRHRFRQMIGKHVRFSWHGSWKRMSRRLGEGFRGKIRDHGLRILVAVDTSGSVADWELAEFANEIENMRMVHKVKSLWVVECDARVQRVYELKPGVKLTAQFHGRGGTAFGPVFEYVDEAKLKLDMLIYLTDSQGSFPAKPQYPVIWAVTTESALGKIPWGDVVLLDVDEPRGTPKLK